MLISIWRSSGRLPGGVSILAGPRNIYNNNNNSNPLPTPDHLLCGRYDKCPSHLYCLISFYNESMKRVPLLCALYRKGPWDNNEKPEMVEARIESQVYLGLIYQVKRWGWDRKEERCTSPVEGHPSGVEPHMQVGNEHMQRVKKVKSLLVWEGESPYPLVNSSTAKQTVTNERRDRFFAQQLERRWDYLFQTSPSTSMVRDRKDWRAHFPRIRTYYGHCMYKAFGSIISL